MWLTDWLDGTNIASKIVSSHSKFDLILKLLRNRFFHWTFNFIRFLGYVTWRRQNDKNTDSDSSGNSDAQRDSTCMAYATVTKSEPIEAKPNHTMAHHAVRNMECTFLTLDFCSHYKVVQFSLCGDGVRRWSTSSQILVWANARIHEPHIKSDAFLVLLFRMM